MGSQLPCDSNGECMVCKVKPEEEETVRCDTCATPWHLSCLGTCALFSTDISSWNCPDCSFANPSVSAASTSHLLYDKGKRQDVFPRGPDGANYEEEDSNSDNQVLEVFRDSFKCSFCMQLPDRPVTILCGHSFCLKCFQRWVARGKRTCAKCRHAIPPKMLSNPSINSALVTAIEIAKSCPSMPGKVFNFVPSQSQPCKAYSIKCVKNVEKEIGCERNMFVSVPPDHFGPILGDSDPQRKQGVLVGETWENLMECRQWGAHIPYVEGVSTQPDYGAQSVAFSGENEHDEDHGVWFLYTGRDDTDLLRSKLTDKSFHRCFENPNEALHVSFQKGYPVRVVRFSSPKIVGRTEVCCKNSTINAGYMRDTVYCCQHADFGSQDQVMVHVHREPFPDGKCKKIQNQKVGPYKILHKINSNIYVLDFPDTVGISNIFNSIGQGNTFSFSDNIVTAHLPPSSNVRNEIKDILDTKIISTRRGGYLKYLVKRKNGDCSDRKWKCEDAFQYFDCDLYEKYQYFNSSESRLSNGLRDESDVPVRFEQYYKRKRKRNCHSNMNLFDRLQMGKHSSYAPKTGIRYDGIYRIEKCWLNISNEGYKVCRYLFVRCDNDPAPWSSDNHGDRPRPLPNIKELETATEVQQRKESPSWDYNDEKDTWMWMKSPPVSRKRADSRNTEDKKRTRKATLHPTHALSVRDRLLKELSCLICRKVMVLPLTTPCAHNFCKSCLLGAFAGQTYIRQRNFEGWRELRAQKNIMKCPSCSNDIFDFIQNPQVNTELRNAVKSLMHQFKMRKN